MEYFDKLLSENLPAARKAVQNVLDEPISQEAQKSFQNPLLPKPYQPRPHHAKESREKRKRF